MAGSRQTISGASGVADFRQRVFGWVVKAVATALCVWLVLLAAGWVLRKLAIGQIVELTGAKVQARSVDVDLDGSVYIEQLVIRPHQSQGGGDAILSADTVDAHFGLWSVISLRPRLEEIRVNSFVFDAQYDLDTGRWNTYAFKIKPPKEVSGPVPVVRLEKGTLKYSKVTKGLRQTVMAVPVDARFGPSDQPDEGYSFDVTTAAIADGLGQSRVTGFWKPGMVTFAGGVSSTDIAAFENVWNIYIVAGVLEYDRSGDYSMNLSMEDLKNRYKSSVEPAASRDAGFLRELGAFSALQGFFYRYRPQAHLDIRLNAKGNLYRLGESEFSGTIDCRDVSICGRKFPYPVEHITGTIDFTQDSVTLNGLCGTHGDVNLRFNGFSKGLGAERRFEMELTSPNMALNSDLFEALSEKGKGFWSAFSPQGRVAIRRRTTNQPGGEKQVSVAVELLGVDAVYSKFPYPLKNVTGRLLFDKDGVSFSDVVSEYDGRRIVVNGRVATADSQEPVYGVSVEAEDIPLDSTLGEALPKETKDFYSQLGMAGSADVRVRILTPADGGSASYVATATLKQASLRLERLPREISDVSGQVVFTPNLIGIERLTGQYGSSLVSLTGRIEPGTGAENLPYSLSLQAERLELNAELLDLLHPTAKQMISRFEPEGRVNLNVELGRSAQSEHTDYKVSVDCLRNSAGLHFTNGRPEGQAGSIVQFTYPLKDISGRLVVTPDSLTFENITARTADEAGETGKGSQIRIDGRLALEDGSFGDGSLQFSAKDIELGERLAAALPGGIGGVYLQLSPTGRFDLDFDKIRIYTAEDGEKCVEYSGVTRFNNCGLSTVPSVSELDGVLETKGLYKFGSGFSQAEVLLSARRAKVGRAVLENLEAKLLYDENRQRWRTDRFLADCYGGRVTGKFDLKRVADKRFDYEFQAGFQDVDLEQFLTESDGAGQEPNLQPQTTVTMAGVNSGSMRDEVREQTRDGRHTSGKVSGSLAVAGRISVVAAGGQGSASPAGQGHHSNSRVGSLQLKIADMRVGKMSPLDKVLCVLRLTEPQDYAFEQMIVDSYLKDDKIMFELMDLSGQTIAFRGSGEMSLRDRSIDLVFLARGSRLAQAEPSVFGSLTESLGSAVVRVDVTGDLYDPEVTTKTLPVIRDALEVFGTKPIDSDS